MTPSQAIDTIKTKRVGKRVLTITLRQGGRQWWFAVELDGSCLCTFNGRGMAARCDALTFFGGVVAGLEAA